jgi:hypothetical protein
MWFSKCINELSLSLRFVSCISGHMWIYEHKDENATVFWNNTILEFHKPNTIYFLNKPAIIGIVVSKCVFCLNLTNTTFNTNFLQSVVGNIENVVIRRELIQY